ncbi:Crossover junction endonuclease mus81 [Elsinoe australis]|uniref:Crossover junction endonuclease mus81 n=1 Tax=Elsinoe australis TaxID=40998 RepID=A0A2P7ZE77_9PEZI|nr:Crossover junction endonuclease mus81 [Elsinoe australis]
MQLQALLTLFLASPQGSLDVPATEDACTSAGGTIVNGQTKNVLCANGNHAKFDDRCKALTRKYTNIPNLKSTCGRK